MIEKSKEIDPKVKIFGSNPKQLVKVRLDYEREPENLLAQLTEFLFKNAGSIDFNSGPPDYWLTMFKGVVVQQSKERRVFKKNLDLLIAQNIKDTGFDPRVSGPPQHVLEQKVNLEVQLSESINKILKT